MVKLQTVSARPCAHAWPCRFKVVDEFAPLPRTHQSSCHSPGSMARHTNCMSTVARWAVCILQLPLLDMRQQSSWCERPARDLEARSTAQGHAQEHPLCAFAWVLWVTLCGAQDVVEVWRGCEKCCLWHVWATSIDAKIILAQSAWGTIASS